MLTRPANVRRPASQLLRVNLDTDHADHRIGRGGRQVNERFLVRSLDTQCFAAGEQLALRTPDFRLGTCSTPSLGHSKTCR